MGQDFLDVQYTQLKQLKKTIYIYTLKVLPLYFKSLGILISQ